MKAETTVLISICDDTSALNLKECLGSICLQHSCRFCILIVADGVISPEVDAVLQKYMNLLELDILALDKNYGLAFALNEGLKKINTEYVTRIDCDDIMQADRLSLQMRYLKAHPDVSAVGSHVRVVNPASNSFERNRIVPEKPEKAISSKYLNPMNHPSVTFRLSDILAVGGYPEFRKAQDRALWCKLMQHGYTLRNQNDYLTIMKSSGKKARAWSYLRYEIQVAKYLYSIKFLTTFQLLANIMLLTLHRTFNEIITRVKL